MKEYEIWTEGYAITGNTLQAIYHGKQKANSFKEAVIKYKNTLPKEEQEDIDIENLTDWGCRFFDNEQDARKAFG